MKEKGSEKANGFYKEALTLMNKSKIPYMIAGAFALRQYTDVYRDTKDLDIFCKPTDYPKFLKLFEENGYKTEVTDPRWLAKAIKGDFFVDIIFSNTSNTYIVDDNWIERAEKGKLFGKNVKILPPEELIISKIFIKNRDRYDGADINHIILRYGDQLKWDRIMHYMDKYWLLLLEKIINYLFVYPSDRDKVPEKIFNELMERANHIYKMPISDKKVCLGPLIDHEQYETDIVEWGYQSFTYYTT